jgi:predicted membrane-bound spermidine synthase
MSAQGRPPQGTGLLCAVFFLSGAAGLLFESLWFRQSGLAFGNGVWASSLVLSSFMAGLALGNLVAARWRPLGARPIAAYALLEVTIAVTGVALVLLLPRMGPLLAPWLGPLLERPALLNALRLALAFALLVVPATAMGATLPLLVQALEARSGSFGSALGRLYGWNTLGAMLGAVAGEAFLIAPLGVRGAALVAAASNLAAAAGALLVGRGLTGAPGEAPAAEEPRRGRALDPRPRLVLAATFLAGLALLALEVVWFRFLHLFVRSSALAFGLLLATVLAGIGVGGLLGGAWLRRDPRAWRHAGWLACLSGSLVAVLYLAFAYVSAVWARRYLAEPAEILLLAALLVLPVSLLSGLLFPLLGAALGEELRPARRATGLLTFANTIGAGLGSLLGGFVLLPALGMERSFFVLAALYLAVAALAERLARRADAPLPRARWAALAGLALALAAFPFGLMEQYFLRIPVQRLAGDQTLIAVREGRTETAQLVRRAFLGEPVSHQLLTDGYSMAGTATGGRRYMKLYVWMPVALRPEPKQALLISFGVGSTAKALVDTRSLEHIDVVDISREILALSDLAYPDPEQHPLRDPRVRVHVEDGRWFLQTTERHYDLITGEPPPPKNAGVVNLYTREYFELVRSRLAPGGIHSYWVPVHELTEDDTRAILRAYCDVFPDCTLWTGTSLDWMLIGSNGARFARDEAAFTAQWRDPLVRPELEAVALERPEQLGATFLADAEQLRAWIDGAEPVTDDFPKRIASRYPERSERAVFLRWMEVDAARERFAASSWVREAWPAGLRERTLGWFRWQGVVNRLMADDAPAPSARERIAELDALLDETDLRTLPLWTLGLTREQIAILERRLAAGLEREPDHQAGLAPRDLAERRFAIAARRYGQLLRSQPRDREALTWRLYALARAGQREEAEAELRRASPWLAFDGGDRGDLDWLRERYGLGGAAVPASP